MLKKELFKQIFNKKNVDVFFLAVALLIGVYFGWKIMEIIIFGIFIWIVINPVPSRWTAVPALAFLIFTPILLIFKNQVMAEEMAIYAYYFLIMSVIMGFYELRKDEKDESASMADKN